MRRLTAAPEPDQAPDELTARAFEALDRRLLGNDPAPVAIGVSGGGDSMALLQIASDWAARRGRRLVAFSVDHRLQPEAAAWSRFAIEAARACGAGGEILAWEGEKPVAGLPAAAREARHRLLARAARRAGARVLLLAHTADDAAESELMRARGSSLGRLREWGPSPAWPEGRDLFLLRPLLHARRDALRTLLRRRGLDWIEDPANDDPAYARSRARTELADQLAEGAGRVLAPDPAAQAAMQALAAATTATGGGFVIDRNALRTAPRDIAAAYVAAALLSAAGTRRPPRGARLAGLLDRLRSETPVSATLAGARIEAGPAFVEVARDAGEVSRGGLAPLVLQPETVSVWDGRFEITVDEPGWRVVPAAGRMSGLEPQDRKAVLALGQIHRGSQPVLERTGGEGAGTRPVLASRRARVRALAASRLAAACGLIAHEAGIIQALMAPEGSGPYVGDLGGPAEAVGIQRPV